MSGPSHGSPVCDSLWNENDQSATRARSATSADVSRSWSRYGSPDSRMRAGSECAVKTTCASVPRTRSARSSTKPGSSRQLSMNTSSARPAERRRPAAPGSRRSTGTSSAERARGRPRSPRRSPARAAAASAMRGAQCFMPVNTGMSPSSRSSAARVASVIAFSGEPSSIPSAPVALDEVVQQLRPDRADRRGCPRSRQGRRRAAPASRTPSARPPPLIRPAPRPSPRARTRSGAGERPGLFRVALRAQG